jgi:hypothetical protein
MDDKMAPEGTFGQVVVRANVLDLPLTAPSIPALLIESIQNRRGYRDIPDEYRYELDPWRDKTIAILAAFAKRFLSGTRYSISLRPNES